MFFLRPYSFGLGKRSDDEEYAESDLSYDSWPMMVPLSDRTQDNNDRNYKNILESN